MRRKLIIKDWYSTSEHVDSFRGVHRTLFRVMPLKGHRRGKKRGAYVITREAWADRV